MGVLKPDTRDKYHGLTFMVAHVKTPTLLQSPLATVSIPV